MYSKMFSIVIQFHLYSCICCICRNTRTCENITAQEDGTGITEEGGSNGINPSQGNESELVQDQSNIAYSK